jgi:hypothetical protein
MVRRLLWVRLVWRAFVLITSLVLGFILAKWVLNFGAQVSYAGLETLGPQVLSVLTQINPYLWWAVVMVGVLLMLSWLRHGYQKSLAAGKSSIVSILDTRLIVSSVSNDTLDVMQWVWNAERSPLTVGDLQRAIKLARGGKSAQLKLARAQALLIENALSEPLIQPPFQPPLQPTVQHTLQPLPETTTEPTSQPVVNATKHSQNDYAKTQVKAEPMFNRE